ncbi:hypothetical protein FF011L_03270 [Roseimaritima multifibrata]|uniref:Uncharacterized protein n=1 Tax=Roseimaritima multifibrata TaxID=1930274 RepID=A0A517M9Y1_9BACT|nr:hypothetical protein FF011L_03270 [Roseimaritima multifibrata]
MAPNERQKRDGLAARKLKSLRAASQFSPMFNVAVEVTEMAGMDSIANDLKKHDDATGRLSVAIQRFQVAFVRFADWVEC